MLELLLAYVDEENKESFEDVYNRYVGMMYRCAYNILKDRQLAEDAVQEAFIKIADNIDKLDNGDTNRNINFVYTITRNRAINIYNKRKKSPIPFDAIEVDIEVLPENYLLSEAMEGLSDEERTLLMLKYVYCFTQKEIAKLLNLKQTTVGVKVKRAADKLGKLIGR